MHLVWKISRYIKTVHLLIQNHMYDYIGLHKLLTSLNICDFFPNDKKTLYKTMKLFHKNVKSAWKCFLCRILCSQMTLD